MANLLKDLVPPTTQRTFAPGEKSVNSVELRTHGPRPAKLTKFSRVFFEKNIGTDEAPRYVEARQGEIGAIPRLRVSVTFDKVKNNEDGQLVLSTKMRVSMAPKSTLAKLIASLAGITPEEVERANIDLDKFIGAPVLASTKAGNHGAVLTTIVSAPIDDDDMAPVEAAA